MADFTIEANIPEIVFSLERMKTDQIPFATSLALNLTLKDAQAQIRKDLPRKFIIRRPWVPRGVIVKPSKKTQLWGSVEQRDAFMTLHETGGTKTPRNRAIAVPVGQLARAAKTRVLRKSERPAAQMRKKSVYRGETKKGQAAIIKRGSRGRPSEVLYLLVQSAKIDARFEFVDTATRTTRKRWERNFGQALARAIKTAK